MITYKSANDFRTTRKSRDELMFKLSDFEQVMFFRFVKSVNGSW